MTAGSSGFADCFGSGANPPRTDGLEQLAFQPGDDVIVDLAENVADAD